jgi:hypothetical protein
MAFSFLHQILRNRLATFLGLMLLVLYFFMVTDFIGLGRTAQIYFWGDLVIIGLLFLTAMIRR